MNSHTTATTTQTPIEMSLMEIYRGYSIREQPLGFTVEGINCHSAPTIESARKAIDCYIDGDKNPQMRGIMESLVSHAMSATKPQHTPGPWIVDDRHIHREKGTTYPRGVEPETDVIVMVDTDCHKRGLLNDTDKANLRLIAAAPALAEALRELLWSAEALHEDVMASNGACAEPSSFAKARAALAAAGLNGGGK